METFPDLDQDHDADPVLAELLAARPTVDPARTDPASPAAVALQTRIVVLPRRPRRPHTRRTPRLAAAAAAAAAVVALVAVTAAVVGVDGPEPASASIEDVAAATDEATGGSGRATVTYDQSEPDGHSYATSGDVAFSGKDVDIVLRDTETVDGVLYELRQRVVGGQLYVSNVPLGQAPRWSVDSPSRPYVGRVNQFDVDPRLLLQMLEAEAGFTVVGEEELDGRPVTHLHAATPDAVGGVDLGNGPLRYASSIDALDVWVGDDDVVYGLDVAVTMDNRTFARVPDGFPCPAGSAPTEDDVPILRGKEGTICADEEDPIWVHGTYSVRFHDLGTPVTISPPPLP